MEPIKTTSRIHPLVAAAAVSVTLVSLVGVAAITGLLPTSQGTGGVEPTPVVAEKTVEPKVADNTPAPTAKPAPPVKVADYQQRPAQYSKPAPKPTQVCHNCGRVESVRSVQTEGQPSGVGVVAGAVLGGVLGNQVGGGNGRKLATVAGAVGGGYAGNEIEKRSRTGATYEVRVRMEDGDIRTFPYNSQPQWNSGDRVRVVDGYLKARG